MIRKLRREGDLKDNSSQQIKRVILITDSTCFIREVNASLGKPKPIAAISATA